MWVDKHFMRGYADIKRVIGYAMPAFRSALTTQHLFKLCHRPDLIVLCGRQQVSLGYILMTH